MTMMIDRPDTPDREAADEPPGDWRLDELERRMGRHDLGVGLLLGLAFVVMIGSVIAVGLIQRNSGGAAAAPVAGLADHAALDTAKRGSSLPAVQTDRGVARAGAT